MSQNNNSSGAGNSSGNSANVKMEKTFSIIKPNAMKRNCIGDIISMFEANGLKIAAAKLKTLSKDEAEKFYAEHAGKAFFPEVIKFMTSAPVLLMCLYGENAVLKNREIMGATDPAKATPGTIRSKFGENVGANAVHGSDSLASAERELSLFFSLEEICNL